VIYEEEGQKYKLLSNDDSSFPEMKQKFPKFDKKYKKNISNRYFYIIFVKKFSDIKT
jgi:hypothetical protein